MTRRFFPIAVAATILYGCSSDNQTKSDTSQDSLAPVVDGYVADTAAMDVPITPDDTAKALKVVYALLGDGIGAKREWKEEDGYESFGGDLTIPFATSMEVIKEYEESYKVRVTLNDYKRVVYVQKKETSDEDPQVLILSYPNFEIRVRGILLDETSPAEAESNDEEHNGPPALVVRRDTFFLYESMESRFERQIQLLPKQKGEQYQVAYSFTMSAPEYKEYIEGYEREIVEEDMPFAPVKDSAGYYYIPQQFESSTEAPRAEKYKLAFRKRNQLRDTNFVITEEGGDYGPTDIHIVFTRKGRMFQYYVDSDPFIRIQRLLNGKVVETRYIRILSPSGGC